MQSKIKTTITANNLKLPRNCYANVLQAKFR